MSPTRRERFTLGTGALVAGALTATTEQPALADQESVVLEGHLALFDHRYPGKPGEHLSRFALIVSPSGGPAILSVMRYRVGGNT